MISMSLESRLFFKTDLCLMTVAVNAVAAASDVDPVVVKMFSSV